MKPFASSLFTIIILLVSTSAVWCQDDSTEREEEPLIGSVSKASFMKPPYDSWFSLGYEYYKPKKEVLPPLREHMEDIEIVAFMGTWCSDSQREIPLLYKLLESIDYDIKRIKMTAVDRSKTTPDNAQQGYDIRRVPTFIFYKGGEEIGRFVEYAHETLEEDILQIVSGKPYKHPYQK